MIWTRMGAKVVTIEWHDRAACKFRCLLEDDYGNRFVSVKALNELAADNGVREIMAAVEQAGGGKTDGYPPTVAEVGTEGPRRLSWGDERRRHD